MKKNTTLVALIVFIIAVFGGCRNVTQPKQEWLNAMPNKISIANIGTSPDISPQDYEKIINQLKMIEIIGKTPKKPNAVDGGFFKIILEYNNQTVTYSFNHYRAENSKKSKFLVSCTTNDKSVFAGKITKSAYSENLEFVQTLI